MYHTLRAYLLALVTCLVFSQSLSAVIKSPYTRSELAECFVHMLKESMYETNKTFQLPSLKLSSDNDTHICSMCLRKRNNSDGPCPCWLCGNCGGGYRNHKKNCVCHICGGTGGYHVGCLPRDWEGLEEHDFEKTIALTSEAIKLNPYNKNAYFSRGIAYFELGKFDEAIADYRSSGEGAYASKSFYQASKEFSQSFLSGVCTGSSESAQEFVPSLCHTTCGIGRTLWTAFNHPIESTRELIGASYEVGECVVDYCRNLDWEAIEGYTEHAKEVCQSFLKLSEAEKGELIGYTIGKYGTEVFTGALVGGTAYKGAEVLQKLRNANRICNLEAMAASAVSKEAVVTAATEHTICRETYFKTVKYNYNDHNKHIVGHTHYEPFRNRSIWEHNDPERLLKEFTGTGIPERGTIGSPGYKESVDFKEHIGIWISKDGSVRKPTTRGTIHYGKKGAHIVPSEPDPKINNPFKMDISEDL